MKLSDVISSKAGPVRLRRTASYALSLALVAAVTLLAVAVDRLIAVPNLSLVFVLPVVVSAIKFGWGPAFVAAVAGVVAYDFFLMEPRYTFNVGHLANAWALVVMLITAAAVSAVAAESRRRALQAREALHHSSALQAMARSLLGARDEKGVARACADTLARHFKAPAVVFVAAGDQLRLAARGGKAKVTPADEEAARWVLASRLPTRGGLCPIDSRAYDFWPVHTPQGNRAVIGVKTSGRQEVPDNPERLVDTVAGYVASALDREAQARGVLESRIALAIQRMKSEPGSTVPHDRRPGGDAAGRARRSDSEARD